MHTRTLAHTAAALALAQLLDNHCQKPPRITALWRVANAELNKHVKCQQRVPYL